MQSNRMQTFSAVIWQHEAGAMKSQGNIGLGQHRVDQWDKAVDMGSIDRGQSVEMGQHKTLPVS